MKECRNGGYHLDGRLSGASKITIQWTAADKKVKRT